MKKLWVYIICIGTITLFSRCDNALDEHLYSSVPQKDFYKNQQQVQAALNGVYGRLWWIGEGDLVHLEEYVGGTMVRYPSKTEWYNHAWTSGTNVFQKEWRIHYNAINRANTLLDKLPETNISSGVKSKLEGQAKFMRALYYFNLVKFFGGVPLYTHGTKNLSNTDKPQSSVKEVYKQIVKDLQDAVQEMNPYSKKDHSAGKATSGAAQALLAKVYAQQKEWSKAASAAKKVINMEVFGLLKDYRNIYRSSNSNNKEVIFSIQHADGGDLNARSGSNIPIDFAPPSFTRSDGKKIRFNLFKDNTQYQANKNLFNTTPATYRKWQTMRNKMPFYYTGSGEFVQDTIALQRPFVVKYYDLNKKNGYLKSGVNFPIIRYSGILLIYAEALNEANGGPSQTAYNAINKVRARARGVGTPNEQDENIYPPLSGLSQHQFRDSVLVEEARELVGEAHRRDELLRHDMFISNAKNRGINTSDTRKLYPIPSEEISRNSNLDQNPGY